MIEIIDTLEKLDNQKSIWQVLEKNPLMRVQQTFSWIRAGWIHFNAREAGAKLQIIKWSRENCNELVYFPFFIDRKKTLRFINDLHSDTNNVVCGKNGNLHYAFLETLEWIMQNPEIRNVHLRQMPSGCEAVDYFAVLARGSVVYRDHGYSWLNVNKSQDVHEMFDHYKKNDRKKFLTLLKRSEEFDFKVYAKRYGDAFPGEVFNRLRESMIANGRRTASYLGPQIFEFAEDLFLCDILEVASLAKSGETKIAAFRLIKENRYLCWIVLNDDSQLPTLLHARYMINKASEEDFIYDFGVGPYGYKLVTFKPRPAPTFSLHISKSFWGQLMAVKDLLVRYAKDYLKPIIHKEQ